MSEVCTTATLPPIVCAPWCEEGDGHVNEMFREDQACRILSGEGIALSRHGYVASSGEIAVGRSGRIAVSDGPLELDRLRVAVFRDLFEEPYFEVASESGTAFKMTPGEARELVGVLAGLLDRIEATA